MFEFLKNLFTKMTVVNDKSFTLDLSEKGVTVNGKKTFGIPENMEKLKKIFGNPRAVTFETKREDKEFLEGMHGKNTVTNRVNYAWDDLGIYTYTLNGKQISCFGIRIGEHVNMYDHIPKKPFCGTLTIKGEPWLRVAKRGADEEVFLRVYMGSYGIIAEYTDDDIETQNRTEQDFTEIEIQK